MTDRTELTTTEMPSKVFTPEEANATLPLVKAITEDLAKLSREVIERRERLGYLTRGRDIDGDNPYGEELIHVQKQLEEDVIQIREYVRELRELGVIPQDGPAGLIDFPSIMDGRLVFLCWKLGEPEVLHWHPVDAGFRGRQPLTAGSVAGEFDSDAEQADS